jgi:hypothetical protein
MQSGYCSYIMIRESLVVHKEIEVRESIKRVRDVTQNDICASDCQINSSDCVI